MKLKLDENLSRHLKPVLAGLGHDVLTAADENFLSRPDIEIARAAKHEKRMLLTLDIEFADLRKNPPGSHPGVILFRPLSLSPLSVNSFVADFIRRTDLEKLAGCIAVVDPVHVRIRSPQKNRTS
jgi:predicted nuclease of predicted toxin-antitoxin system